MRQVEKSKFVSERGKTVEMSCLFENFLVSLRNLHGLIHMRLLLLLMLLLVAMVSGCGQGPVKYNRIQAVLNSIQRELCYCDSWQLRNDLGKTGRLLRNQF